MILAGRARFVHPCPSGDAKPTTRGKCMLEIEQKYARADFAELQRRLAGLEAQPGEEVVETDQYFNAPDRDFALTGEAFRLRQIGTNNFLTYKGPRAAHAIKTRTELEIPLPPGDAAAKQHAQLLAHLGYRPVAVVRKRRRSFHLDRDGFPWTVCLDDVESLGCFAEVEVLAQPDQADAARMTLLQLARELGLQEIEQRSYLTMLLATRPEPVTTPALQVVHDIPALRRAVREARGRRRKIGLVPTMGALHEGHLSLIAAARRQTDFVVVSIFVNPTQFGPTEDLSRYPRRLEQDRTLCQRAGVDLVFAPEPATMYPPGYRTWVEVTGLQDVLCGASRPGHFRGVATVVLKLLNQVQPDRAYFGQKDAQQARIIRQMVRDLDVPVEIVICPIVREPDGLALSSRNTYLNAEQRRAAVVLSHALQAAQSRVESGERDADALQRQLVEQITRTPGAVLDYAAVVDAEDLTPVRHLIGPTLLALAVKFGDTRLIDNITVIPPGALHEPPSSPSG